MEKQKKKLNSKKIWLLVILLSIVFIPSFYGYTYLKSYWNNGTAINKVPIAVVNLDQPYSKDGQTYDIGKTIIDNLKNNNTLDWKFVNYNEGNAGLYGTKYYAMIVIPKDFSKEVANATTDGFKKPQIDFYQNQGKNFIFSEISTSAAQNIQENVAQSISKSVSSVLVQTIYKTKDGFKTAADGSNQLNAGLEKLKDGSISLNSGIQKLQNGSEKLDNGVDKLQDGSSKLVSGVNKLQDGSSKLVSGVDKLQDGSSNLVSGVNKLQDGSSKLVGGVQQLQDGSSKLENGVQRLQDGSSKLVSGMQKLEGGSQKLQDGVQQLQDGSSKLVSGMQKLQAGANGIEKGQEGITEELKYLNVLMAKGDIEAAKKLSAEIAQQSAQLNAGMNSLNAGINNASEGANRINSGLSSLGNGVSSLSNGINNASNGVSQLNSGLNSVSNGASQLNSGLNSVSNGASQLNNGLNSVGNGVNALNNGLGSVKNGANAIDNGLGAASTGAAALNNGLGTVSNGMNSLNNGLVSASAGGNQLTNGLNSASSGASKLSSGLNSGYDSLNKNVTFSAENMSEFIANPISLNTIVINPVSSYGEGFAPYFMCIGSWVGAMYVYYMISALSRKFKGSFKKRFIKMYGYGTLICSAQSLLMSTFVYFGLGIHSKTPGWFYLINLISMIAIFSLMNGLHYIITPIMKGAITVLMVLQFTSCGGSYPVVMLPSFFRAISPFMILTHSVTDMRMAISGINYTTFYNNLIILILFIVVSTIVGFLVGYTRNHMTHRRVMREKNEMIREDELFNQYV